jgi:hypothetical protein
MRPTQRKPAPPSTAAYALPAHWTPEQALAVFECLSLMREQLWLAYGADIQRAWRDDLQPNPVPTVIDPDSPF